MIDVIAAVLVLCGAAAMLLAGIGMLRFPDVFTRMHASAKAAVVGVVATTAAAALESDSGAGLLTLLLVVALLFLSGPLGISLLARAAYHDPETPRSPATRELRAAPLRGNRSPARSGAGAGPALTLWLLIVWVTLFESWSLGVVIGGLLAAVAVATTLRALAPRWPEAFLHPLRAARFVGHFIRQVVASTWQVARALFIPADTLRPAVIEFPVRVSTRNEVTLLINAISFTPGTVAVEFHDGRLFVHALHNEDTAALVGDIAAMEDRILAAFGTTPP